MVAIRRFLEGAADGPHPERVHGARDPRVAMLRLTDRHHGVALRQRDVCWLLTVLPEDEALAYARRYGFGVNPEIGVIEMWDAEALERVLPALRRSAQASERRLFHNHCDADLVAVGVDPRLIPYLRLITTETALDALEPLLPPTQYAPLAALARQRSLAAAWRTLVHWRTTVTAPGPIDPDDVVAALDRSPHRAVFITGTDHLDRVIDAPEWCFFLHPAQHRLSRTLRYDRPVLVTGGAGTGKTLIALHRAAYLAEHGSGPVLLVTFSQGLSGDLAARLDELIPDEALRKRVEVSNVDRLAHRIVTEAEGRPPTLVDAEELAELWRDAAEGERHSPAFLLREWEQVVLAQNLTTLDEYLRAARPGRGVGLDATERTAVWRTIERVVERLRERGRRTLLQLAAEASVLLGRATGDLLAEGGPAREPYRHIVVDEAQDLHPAQWRLLRAAVPYARDDLFIVGDPHQRILDTRVPLSAVGIDAEHFRLEVSYRLPAEILSWGVRLRGGGPADGLVEDAHGLAGFRADQRGARPLVQAYESGEAELAGLVDRLREWREDGVPASEIAVAARSAELVRRAREALHAAGLDVRVTSLHGMKGLEFRRVAVIGVSDGIVPDPDALTPVDEDPAARAHDLQRERGLLYVACTRAAELLYVSYSGRASPFLPL